MSQEITSRELTEDASFGDVLEESLNEIYVFDSDSLRFLRVNRGARENLGYSNAELSRLTPVDLKPAFSQESFREMIRPLRDGEVQRLVFETRHQRKDGSLYDVEVHLQVTQFRGVPCFAAIILDTTDRRRAEQQIRIRNEAIKSAAAGIVLTDLAGMITYANPAFLRMWGYKTQDEVIGRSNAEFSSSEQDVGEVMEGLMTEGSWFGDRVALKKDGTPFDVQVAASVVRDQDGQPECLMASFIDISKRKNTEKALNESQEFVRAVVNTAADAIITIGQDGIVQGVNPATERIFGYSEQELIGENISILMPEPYRSEHDGYIARYVEEREPHIIGIGREAFGRRKDGAVFPIDLAVSEVDHLGIFAGVIRDISERKELQRQVLEIAAEEQRRIGQDLHDGTQQELTGLGLIAQNLVDTLDGKGIEFLADHGLMDLRKVAVRLSDGISETNKNVQMLSRGLVPVEVDSRGLMSALEELAAKISEVHSAKCTFQCAQAVEFTDNFQATHVFRIAQEAVTNALKHGQPDEIRIALSQQSNCVSLTVMDNGQGIQERCGNSPGRGLKIMGYRAGLIGATFKVAEATGGGTLVTCTIPMF